jgi:anti-anti-sigma factor
MARAFGFEVAATPASEWRVRVQGEIDRTSANHLRDVVERVAKITASDVVVDCAELRFIDSTGVRALLDARDTLEALRVRLALENVGDEVRMPLAILGVCELLGVEPQHDDPVQGVACA